MTDAALAFPALPARRRSSGADGRTDRPLPAGAAIILSIPAGIAVWVLILAWLFG